MTKYNLSIFDQNIIAENYSHAVSVDQYDSLLNFINKAMDPNFNEIETGIMPPGVLAINHFSIIYERPPQFQNIQVIPQTVDNINYDNSDMRMYRLPIPWQLYICTYSIYNDRYYPNSVRMFFMNSSLTNSDINNHRLYLPPLPNFYSSALLCNPMFASMEDVERYENNIAGVIQASYDWIWNSGTNLDLTMAVVEAFYQLPAIAESGTATVLDKVNSRYYSSKYSDNYYLPFMHIDALFTAWETYELHEISNLVWPNVSSSDRVYFDTRDIGDSMIPQYFAHAGIDPDTPIEPTYSSCDDEECEDCHSEDYLYDRSDYTRFVRANLSNIRTFEDAYNQVLLALDDNMSSYNKSIKNIVLDLYTKTLGLT